MALPWSDIITNLYNERANWQNGLSQKTIIEEVWSDNLNENKMCQCLYHFIPNRMDLPLGVQHQLNIILNKYIVYDASPGKQQTYVSLFDSVNAGILSLLSLQKSSTVKLTGFIFVNHEISWLNYTIQIRHMCDRHKCNITYSFICLVLCYRCKESTIGVL